MFIRNLFSDSLVKDNDNCHCKEVASQVLHCYRDKKKLRNQENLKLKQYQTRQHNFLFTTPTKSTEGKQENKNKDDKWRKQHNNAACC